MIYLIDQSIDPPIDGVIDLPIEQLIDRSMELLINQLIDWLIDPSIIWSIDWTIDCFTGYSYKKLIKYKVHKKSVMIWFTEYNWGVT